MKDDKVSCSSFLDKNAASVVKAVRFKYGLEPAYFLLNFGFNLANAILQNQLLKQMCLQLGHSSTMCVDLKAQNVETEIQPYVAGINSSILMLNSIVPAILGLLLGSWTDKYGRKKVLMISFTGYTSTMGLIMLISFISDNITPLSPWYYLIAVTPMCLLGGWPTLDIAVCCYITDLSEPQARSLRMGTITFLNFLSNFLAYFSSSFILEATNAPIVFTIAFCCALAGFIFTAFFVDESIQVTNEASAFTQFIEIFSISRVREIGNSLCEKRKERRTLWTLMAIVILIVFTMHGNGTVNYLFVREKFGWDLREWTIFDSISTAITVFGMFFGLIVLKKLFKISDMTLGILALSSALIESLCKAFAAKPYQIYLASVFGVLKLLSGPVLLSIMSTILSHNDIGKVFSATTSLGALSGLLAGPLYATVYNATFTTFTGAIHLITASICTFDLIFAVFVTRWRSSNEREMKNTET